MPVMDLNVDAGESFGLYRMAEEELLLAGGVSSVNVACGFHAGDPQVMERTVATALRHGIAVGAHPGLPDLQGFGRRVMAVSAAEVYAMTLYQVGALAAIVRAAGGRLRHVKPHGALYHMACEQRALADALVSAVAAFDPELRVFAPAASQLAAAAGELRLRVVREAFADRVYEADGRLRDRRLPGALLSEPGRAAEQALRLALPGSGVSALPPADTLCIHGDHPGALQLLQAVRSALTANGVEIRAPHAGTGY